MVEKIVHENGSITWRYKSIDELIEDKQRACENPNYLDLDLELKDRQIERMD